MIETCTFPTLSLPPAQQFHPEFKSRPFKPSPLFLGLILAAAGKLDHFLSGTRGRRYRSDSPRPLAALSHCVRALPPTHPTPAAPFLPPPAAGRATPVASPAKTAPRPMDTGTIAALTAAKLQL